MAAAARAALPLATARLRLRDARPGDFAAVHRYASDPEVTRHLSWGPNREADTRAFLELAAASAAAVPRTLYSLLVEEAGSGEAVGGCGIELRRPHAAEWEIGYCLARHAWGRGLATEIVRALLDFGFERLDAHRIYAQVFPENAPSARVCEKVGMLREGRLRSYLQVRGEWRDALVYAALAGEWPGARG